MANRITPNYHGKHEGEVQNLAGVPEEFLDLFEHDPSEIIIYQALRHKIGTVMIILTSVFTVLLTLFMVVFLSSANGPFATFGIDGVESKLFAMIISVGLIMLIAVFGFLAERVYVKSRLILTNQKVVLIQYHSLIAREVSQLNIGEVEDVNVFQTSIFDRIFKMGTITIETAGEQNNYNLKHISDPYKFAHKTIQMHEGSISEYGN